VQTEQFNSWLGPEILRCAQDDSLGFCHPERSEGSLVDFWGITRQLSLAHLFFF